MLVIGLLGAVGIVMLFPQNSSFRKPALFGFLLVTGLTAALVSMFYVKRTRLKRFSDREVLSREDIYARYFRDSGLEKVTIVSVWEDVAKVLALPPEKLRPTDRFDQELRPLSEWYHYDDNVEHLFAWALKSAKIRGVTVNFDEVQTLGDFVTLMAKLRKKE